MSLKPLETEGLGKNIGRNIHGKGFLSLRESIYGIFHQLEDARFALGQVKKTSLNRAQASVIYSESAETVQEKDAHWETAAEGFIGDALLQTRQRWPGLKTGYLDGVGSVKYGSLSGGADLIATVRDRETGLRKALSEGKIVAVVKAEPEAAAEVRLIFENCGAEILSNQAEA